VIKYYKYPQVLASFDPRIWVTHGNKLIQIRVLILETKILAGTDTGDPRVDSCPALDGAHIAFDSSKQAVLPLKRSVSPL